MDRGDKRNYYLNVMINAEKNMDAKRILLKALLIIIENVEKIIQFTLSSRLLQIHLSMRAISIN